MGGSKGVTPYTNLCRLYVTSWGVMTRQRCQAKIWCHDTETRTHSTAFCRVEKISNTPSIISNTLLLLVEIFKYSRSKLVCVRVCGCGVCVGKRLLLWVPRIITRLSTSGCKHWLVCFQTNKFNDKLVVGSTCWIIERYEFVGRQRPEPYVVQCKKLQFADCRI
jgi:hypothetical protein